MFAGGEPLEDAEAVLHLVRLERRERSGQFGDSDGRTAGVDADGLGSTPGIPVQVDLRRTQVNVRPYPKRGVVDRELADAVNQNADVLDRSMSSSNDPDCP